MNDIIQIKRRNGGVSHVLMVSYYCIHHSITHHPIVPYFLVHPYKHTVSVFQDDRYCTKITNIIVVK